eukprot:129679-Rhodomonas_salina.1
MHPAHLCQTKQKHQKSSSDARELQDLACELHEACLSVLVGVDGRLEARQRGGRKLQDPPAPPHRLPLSLPHAHAQHGTFALVTASRTRPLSPTFGAAPNLVRPHSEEINHVLFISSTPRPP